MAAGRVIDFSKQFIKVKMPIRIWTLSHRKQTLLRNLPKAQGKPSNFFHVLLPHTVLNEFLTADHSCTIFFF